MSNKINNLIQKYNELKKNIYNFKNLGRLNNLEFYKYKSLICKKENIYRKIQKLENSKQLIINTYNLKNQKWLYDDNINCNKYCKLEKKADYIKNKKLYNLGFTKNKPVHPFVKSFKQHFYSGILNPIAQKSNPIKHFFNLHLKYSIEKSPICTKIKNINNYKNNVIPKKLTKLAISGTKHFIIGYRELTNSANYFSRSISSLPAIQIIAYINRQAKKELETQSNSFKSRIMVDPNSYNFKSPKANNVYNDFDMVL